MEGKKVTKCSICGETEHNKRTCPQRPIDDTNIREAEEDEYVVENVYINQKKEYLLRDLLQREEYDIDSLLFKAWLRTDRPIQLKELRYVIDHGLNRDSVELYLELVNDINEYY